MLQGSYHFYADESCKDDNKYLILGGLAVNSSHAAEISERLKGVRKQHNTFGETKWVKVSKSKITYYRDYSSIFFEYAAQDKLHFHSLVVDTSTFNHSKHSDGDAEIGFNKLIYQLLLHRVGRRYGDSRICVYLDHRQGAQPAETLRPMLNAALAKDWRNSKNPFRLMRFVHSHDSEFIQLNDLLIGALGFRKNGKHLREDASQLKKDFAEHLSQQAATVQKEHPTHLGAKRFTIWEFAYRKNGF